MNATTPSDGLTKALALVTLGLHVFPAREKDEWVGDKLYESKSPYTRRGFLEATTDTTIIENWWAQWPGALPAVSAGASGLVVLDIDIDLDKGTDGWHEMTEADLDIPDTFNYQTRRGGSHYVYLAPDPQNPPKPAKNYVTAQGTILEGVDRRSGGSYVVWWGDVPESLESLSEAPLWFLEDTPTVSGSHYEGSVEDWLETIPQGAPSAKVIAAVERIPEGDFGHTEMIRQQTHLVKLASEGEDGVGEALMLLYDAWVRAPYNTPENHRDFEVSLAGAVAKFGGVTEAEKEFWTRRPILEHTFDASRKLMASPWALLGGLVLRAMHCVPHNVAYRSQFGPGSLNMINVFVGDSGGGKSLLQSQLGEVYNFGRGFVAHEVGSGEAISEQFIEDVDKVGNIISITWNNSDHSEMFSFDEVGRLNALSGRSGGSTILEYLKTGWSGGRLGRKLVGGKGIEVPEHEYRMTVFLNAQPERADLLLSEDEIAGGFPGRVMWVNTQDPTVVSEYRPGKVTPYPIPLIKWGKDQVAVHALPEMNEAHVKDRQDYHFGTREALDGHELMLKVRIAVAFMVLDGRKELNDEDWELAEVALNHSRTTRKMVQQRLADKRDRDTEVKGKADGRRESIARESADDHSFSRARTQVASAIEKLQEDGKKPTKGVVRSKMTRSLQSYLDDIWEEMGMA